MRFTLIILIIFIGCISCSTTTETFSGEWEEKGYNAETEIKHGVPVFKNALIDYKRNGETIITVRVSEPVIVDVAEKPERWGYFQFPGIFRSLEGSLVATWSMASDNVTSYGKGNLGVAISHNEGKTWNSNVDKMPVGGGVELPNGERINIHTPKALNVGELQLPDSLGEIRESYGRTLVYYRLDDLPKELQGVYIKRLAKGNKSWEIEHGVLNDTKAVRYTDSGLFPVVWWGDMQVAPDGSVIAGIYPYFYLDDNNKVPHSGIGFYRSTDDGHTWNVQGRIPYQPDLMTDPNGDRRIGVGYTEPASILLSNGTYLCVMRTSDGLGDSPMYLSYSTDMGLNWTKPTTFTRSGVFPKLLQLENGIIVLASGRPGLQVRFATDGKGKVWTDPFEMLPFENVEGDVSCGYPGILPLGPDRFLLIYSDFKHQIENGELRKAIKVREIQVKLKRGI
ncbi:MAG: sialidase family protein [Fermentimonas sp.]